MTDIRAQLLAQLDRAVPASKSHEVFDALLRATRAEVERHADYYSDCEECGEVWPCRYLRDLFAAIGEEGK